MMIKYWWMILIGALFSLSGCAFEKDNIYPIQGISAYKGQDVSSLINDNGAPNVVRTLADGRVIWIYYTSYRPVGGGELISYDMPPDNQIGTTCMVKVILKNDIVIQVVSNCD